MWIAGRRNWRTSSPARRSCCRLRIGATVGSGFATWGCGDYQALSGDGGQDSGDWGGEAFSVQVGADAIVGRNLLAGLSLSQSRGALDFDGPGGAGPTGGSYDLGLTGIHPTWAGGYRPAWWLWGFFGVAHGDLEIADAAAGSSATSAATLASGHAGHRRRLLALGATTVRLKARGRWRSWMSRRTRDCSGARRRRCSGCGSAAEVEYEHLIADAGVLVPWGELGLRHEGGDAGPAPAWRSVAVCTTAISSRVECGSLWPIARGARRRAAGGAGVRRALPLRSRGARLRPW